MTSGCEEKSKKATKLKAKLTQEVSKEAPLPNIPKNEDVVAASTKKAGVGSGNHKKS